MVSGCFLLFRPHSARFHLSLDFTNIGHVSGLAETCLQE